MNRCESKGQAGRSISPLPFWERAGVRGISSTIRNMGLVLANQPKTLFKRRALRRIVPEPEKDFGIFYGIVILHMQNLGVNMQSVNIFSISTALNCVLQ